MIMISEQEKMSFCQIWHPIIIIELMIFAGGNTVRGMICILNQWVKGNHGLVELRLCWHSVAYIIADSIGGKNPAAAKKIANNFQRKSGRAELITILMMRLCSPTDYQNTEYMDGDDSALGECVKLHVIM